MDLQQFKEQLHLATLSGSKLDELPLETLLDGIPSIEDLGDLPAGTVVLVRADIDTPIKDGVVTDSSRIEACAPTIRYCIEKGWKTVIFGHVGREKTNTAEPVRVAMSQYLGRPITLFESWLDEEKGRISDALVDTVAGAGAGSLIMLQNTRKYDLERGLWKTDEETFPAVAEKMYPVVKDIRERLTSVEINEGIAASNKDFSSTAIPLLMERTALGFYIAHEMKAHIQGVRQANCVVFSGLKIDKLDALEGIIDRGRLSMIITGGSLAMALKKARARLDGGDFFIGVAETDPSIKAYIDNERIEQAKRIIGKCEDQKVDLVLPVDFVLDTGEVSETIPDGRAQMDVGPATRRRFEEKVLDYIEMSKDASKPYAMFYNGVLGKSEDPRFAEGTKSFIGLLKKMTEEGVATYVGGGEGRQALLEYGDVAHVTHAFTCGGTVLKSLTNNHIAFLKAMYLQNTAPRD